VPAFSRHVTVDWSGPLKEGGKGVAHAGTGAFNLPVTFASRIAEPEGATSPEELIAGAHGVCYAMVVAGALGRAGGKAEKTHVTCTVTADLGEGGIKIVKSTLDVVAEGLSGIAAADFPKLAKDAEGKCPVSNALRGSLQIEVNASVK
jgi:osmotically inducible protein OsmC